MESMDDGMDGGAWLGWRCGGKRKAQLQAEQNSCHQQNRPRSFPVFEKMLRDALRSNPYIRLQCVRHAFTTNQTSAPPRTCRPRDLPEEGAVAAWHFHSAGRGRRKNGTTKQKRRSRAKQVARSTARMRTKGGNRRENSQSGNIDEQNKTRRGPHSDFSNPSCQRGKMTRQKGQRRARSECVLISQRYDPVFCAKRHFCDQAGHSLPTREHADMRGS